MFEKGDRVRVIGLPGAAGSIFIMEEERSDEEFIGMTGEVTRVRDRMGHDISQVKLDDGGIWWWENSSLEHTNIPNEDLPLEMVDHD